MGYWLVDCHPSSGRWCNSRIDLVDELVLDKNGLSTNNNYLHTVLNSMTLLCTKDYQNWSMSVEDIANQRAVSFLSMTKKTHFRVHDSQGSAETLVRRGEITNYHIIAYSFSNISAKNYQNRLMCIEVIVCNITVIFTARGYAKRGICCRCVSVCVSVCLCVCVSVTLQYCIKMAKRRITQTPPHDSPMTLVFWCQRSWRNSNGITRYGGDKCRWGGLTLVTFDEKRAVTRKRYKIDV